MKEITQQHLINAFGGESMAHMRYLHFANQAERESYDNIARLFRAISHAEYVHAGDHFREIRHLEAGLVANSAGTFGPGNTEKNLKLAWMGENFEIEEMYPAYIDVAKLQGEEGALRSFSWSYETEKVHRALYEVARQALESGKDMQLGKVQICEVCGWTVEGEAPDECPLCKAKKERFREFA